VAQKAYLSFKNKFHYISAIDEASNFKFGKPLGFAKAHNQIPLEEKLVVILVQGSSPKSGAFHLIFLQRLELATSNLVRSQGPS